MVSILIAAAAREPEATEQGSTLIDTEIYLCGLASAFLQNAKDVWSRKDQRNKALWLILWSQCMQRASLLS